MLDRAAAEGLDLSFVSLVFVMEPLVGLSLPGVVRLVRGRNIRYYSIQANGAEYLTSK
jgi:hypothetical protein